MADIKPEPGRQYVCVVRGRGEEIVLTCFENTTARIGPYLADGGGSWYRPGGEPGEVTVLRPLYTLDLGPVMGDVGAATLARVLRRDFWSVQADQIEAQIPKPARMDEPAWGEKVTAHTETNPKRRTFLRYSRLWIDDAAKSAEFWSELIDPEPYDEASRG